MTDACESFKYPAMSLGPEYSVEWLPEFPPVHKYHLADINYEHVFSPGLGLL
jgi:hypothetical protein